MWKIINHSCRSSARNNNVAIVATQKENESQSNYQRIKWKLCGTLKYMYLLFHLIGLCFINYSVGCLRFPRPLGCFQIDIEKKKQICKESAKATMLRVGVSTLMQKIQQIILSISFHVKDKFLFELCEKIIDSAVEMMINARMNDCFPRNFLVFF